ncbi:MAG: V-type ATPase 116kDa subunit family protein [Leptospirales bacterium]
MLHIEPVSLKGLDDNVTHIPIEEEKLEKRTVLEQTFEKVKNLLFMLPAASEPLPLNGSETLDDVSLEVEYIDTKIHALFLEKEDLEEEIHHLKDYEQLLAGFVPIASELGGLKNYEIMGLTVDTKRTNVISLLEKEVDKITDGKYEIHTSPLNSTTTGLVLAVSLKEAAGVRRLFFGEGIQELKLPTEYEDQPLLKAISGMAKREKEASLRMIEVKNELNYIANEWQRKLEWAERESKNELDEIAALRHFAQTRYCFIIEGWIPVDSFPKVKKEMNLEYGDTVLVKELEFSDEDRVQAPVHIQNRRWIKPFEVFLRALPTPKYGTVDPTPLIAFFFPAFFGIIVGDMGYGLIIASLGLFMRYKLRNKEVMRDLMSVFVACGVSAFFFGLLFGELFGTLGEDLHLVHPLWFDRLKGIKSFLVISLGIGVGHVLFGILIGLYSKLKQKHFKEAGVKFLFLVLTVSFIVLMLALFKQIPTTVVTPVFSLFIAILITLIVLEGVLGIVEFVEAISNILSYVRIMAIGASSVILALVANKVGEAMGNIVIGIIVAALIHIMNIIISLMSPTIQSMRLQYVEFLGKFYEDGGKPYAPFKNDTK